MGTVANLIAILFFLAAFYTFLGLLCGITEKLQALVARPNQRRRVRRRPRRRMPRRGATVSADRGKTLRLQGATAQLEAAGVMGSA